VAFCRVTYRDVEGIDHTAEVSADSLYEAVAMAIARFRREDGWVVCPPGPGCEFQVKVMPDSPVTHTVSLKKVETFALHGTAAGPKEVVRKERIRKLLGIYERDYPPSKP
jgi:hypothetical protein